jgi:hypothetical protein
MAAVGSVSFGGFPQELFDTLVLIPRDVAWVDVVNASDPIFARNEFTFGTTIGKFPRAGPPKGKGSCVARIMQGPNSSPNFQRSPDELAFVATSEHAFGKQ